MIRKLIGTAEVRQGKAEYLWEIGEGTVPGKRKIHITYVEDDGYIGGEAYEDAYIRTPTSILMAEESAIVNPTTDTTQPETITLTAVVNAVTTLGAVPEGKVQFLAKTESDEGYVHIGGPVDVVNGTATMDYEIPQLPQTTILVKAQYLANTLYGGCETENIQTIHVRGLVEIGVENLTTNPGNRELITATVLNQNGNTLETGEVKFYLDGTEISTNPVTNTAELRFRYEFPQDIQSGRHELRVEYLENDQYKGAVATAYIDIRTIVVIEAVDIHAPQTITENNVIKARGVAHIPVNIRTSVGLPVTEGTVTFTAGNESIDVELSPENDSPVIDWNIPSGYAGGERIPYTLEYAENTNYQGVSAGADIVIKFRAVVTIDTSDDILINGQSVTGAFAANLGDVVQLGATIVDENGDPIDEGEIIFELEQLPNTPDGNIGGQEEETGE